MSETENKIKKFAKLNFHSLKPEVEHSENIIKQISLINSQLNNIKNDLEDNV